MTVQKVQINAEEIFQKQWLTYQTVRDTAQGLTFICTSQPCLCRLMQELPYLRHTAMHI